ncbi:uncharacterized protein LOC126272309 isoform X2 [Schistocerca gregaria]|uniref:uncharacterized protein LOC126272309 isoform X2 n=1 Tax=Schistocerca gregaria TaxID=7010 RepID=UPI00211E8EC9|nr:uncharacterized protein LOC126272309 isoform X2 [Schistocerca gregaria]
MRCGGPAVARMAATDGQIVCAAARWSDEAQYLRELVSGPRPLRLPAVVKVTRGQYGGLGVPSLPAPALQPAALIVSAGRRRKLAAQAVKLKEGGRMAAVGPRLAIPETYPGYFELLSEEGRAVRCIEGVGELSRRAGLSGACLVREPVRAFPDPGPGPAVAAVAALPPDGARAVPVGETLTPTGEVTVGKSRYLRCVDGRGESLLVPLEQRGGRFSAVAREDSISGVHSARNLLAKRLPLTVRLVHGPPPAAAPGASSARGHRHFAPELRLLAAYEEEHVFALPLGGHHRAASAAAAAASEQLLALPLAAPLKVVRARNEDALRGMHEFVRLAERAARLLADVADKMQVLDGKLGDPKALRLLSSGVKSKPSSGHLLRRSASSDSANLSHHRERDRDRDRDRGHDENRCPPPPPGLADEYDEIDQIYDYVRGFAPLPKNIRSPFADPQPAPSPPGGSPPLSPTSAPGHLVALAAASPPEPPPIETIPTKKMQHHKAEKRTRRKDKDAGVAVATVKEKSASGGGGGGGGGGGLYIKHGGSGAQHGRQLLHRQKSASASAASRPGSPPLGVRYKSLSNLQQAMEVDGTLDSSHSGGRTSGDSGAGAKLPEKRSRRLSRPRSLTNLVWELRGGGGDKGHNHAPPPAGPQLPAAAPAGAAVGRKPKLSLGGGGGSSHKRLGTLYL